MQRLFDSKRNTWAAALIICLIAVALSFGLAIAARGIFGATGFGDYRRVDVSGVEKLDMLRDGFVCYDGSTVTSFASDGKTRWSYMVGANAGFDATNYGTASWQDRTITLIDKNGSTVYNGTFDDTVLSAKMGPRYTAIVTGTEEDPTIILMENSGRQVNHILMNHVAVIDYGFFQEGSLLWVMACDTSGTVPICRILTYRPGKELAGAISDNEQLDYAVFFRSTNICVAGDIYFKTYDYTGTEDTAKRKLIYGWNLVDYDNTLNDPLLAFVNDAQYRSAEGVRDVRLIRSDQDFIVRLPIGCAYVLTNGDNVYGFASDGHLMTLSTQDHSVKSYPGTLRADKVYGITSDNHAVVGSEGSIYMLDLNK